LRRGRRRRDKGDPLHRAGQPEGLRPVRLDAPGFYQAGVDLEEAGRGAQAIRRYLAAAKIDDGFADLHFRLGRCCLALERLDEAKSHYVRARDLDALRFRADTRINAVIREVASDLAPPGVHLVDAERVFEQSRAVRGGIPGEELFHEHVHMKFEGNYELARAVFHKVVELLPEYLRSGAEGAGGPASKDRCAELLALTGLDRRRIASQIWATTARPPFTNQLDHAKWRARFFGKVQHLKRHGTPEARGRALAACRKALQADGDDLVLRRSLAHLLEADGQFDESAAQWRAILQRLGDNADAHMNLGAVLLGGGKADDAKAGFDRALELAHRPVEYHNQIGEIHVQYDKPDEAIEHFRGALDLEPAHPIVLNNLGRVFFEKKDYGRAIAELSKAARLRPGNADIRSNFGAALFMAGRIEEAAGHLAEAVRLDPYSAVSHDRYAAALVRQGNLKAAADHLAEAVRLDPDNPRFRRRHEQVLRRLPGGGASSQPASAPAAGK